MLSQSAQKVQSALQSLGLNCRVMELPDSTRTANEAALAAGCDVGQIAKSLIFRSKESNRPVMVIASGPNRVDETLIHQLLGEPIEKADADFVRVQTGYAIGGIPPIGLIQPIITFIDKDLLQYQFIWAAAGTPHAIFELNSQELQRITAGTIAQIHR